MARDLVRIRRNVHKFYQMSTQLQAVGLRMQTLRSSQQMSEAMRGATKVRDLANAGTRCDESLYEYHVCPAHSARI